MTDKQARVTSVATKTLVRIFSYEDQVLIGSVSNEFYGRTMYFRDVVQMAAILESLFDSLAFPQSSMAYRSFRAPAKRRPRRQTNFMKAGGVVQTAAIEPMANKEREKASFVVHVQFRQNATWQGTITWVNKGVTQHFRSVLEMIRLMTEAVEATGETPEINWVQETE